MKPHEHGHREVFAEANQRPKKHAPVRAAVVVVQEEREIGAAEIDELRGHLVAQLEGG